MSLYELSVPQFIKILGNLDKWFDKAEAHAQAKKFDTSVYLAARLAPDQLPFLKQVHIATDSAKLGVARVTGKEAPSFADDETTLGQLRERIQKTIAYLDTITPADFEGAATRVVTRPDGTKILGQDQLVQHTIPTFYFHAVTTYALLRHNGVDLGKKDYLGALKLVS
ncbi:MAG: DUF1993 domain-containing protein [Polyangiales bacterium]